MKIINDGLPEPIFNFLKTNFYDLKFKPDTLSATTLLKPVQEILLTQRHYDEIEIPASERLWSVWGSAIHEILDKAYNGHDVEKEERLSTTIGNWVISGKFDLIVDGILHDYKSTSAWTIVYGSRTEEWIKQLSIYRYLYLQQKNKLLSPEAKIITMLRDWASRDVGKKGYPATNILEIPIKLLGIDEIKQFIKNKLKLIDKFINVPDSELPACSDADRWWNEKQKVYIKCERKYCVCHGFCSQYQKVKGGG